MSIESVMPSTHLILCHPFLFLSSIFPSIRVFSSESALHIKWPKYWSFSISPSNDHSGLISFRNHGFDILAVHGTLQHHSLKALGVISLKYIFGSPKKVLSPRNDFTSSNPWDCCILSQQPFSHWRDKPSLSPTGRHILSPCFLPLSQSDSAGELRAWIFKEFPAKTACCVPFPTQDDWDDVTSCNGNVGRALTRDPHRVLFQCVGIFSHYTENISLLFFFFLYPTVGLMSTLF